jgi:tetratricopeptide (TPR) repeat protein
MNDPVQRRRRLHTAAALVGLLLLTIAVYARGMTGEFEFDDVQTVQHNRNIRHIGSLFTTSFFSKVSHARRASTEFVFALNYWATGLAPLSFHLTNLAIHLAVALLVFFFTRRILTLGGATGEDFLAVVVAGAFALHPLQTQAVVYISQCSELLASACYLGSLLLLLRAERHGLRAAGVASYLASLALFVLGFGAKAIVATFPVAYLLTRILAAPRRPWSWARSLGRLGLALPYFAFALWMTVSSVGFVHGEDSGFNIPNLPPIRYFLTQWHVVATYVRLLFWPSGQNLDWDFPLARGPGEPTVLISGLFLALLIVVAAVLFQRCRLRADSTGAAGRVAAFGIAWFFVLLAPTSSVLPLADVLMEHRPYLASWGLFLATAILVRHLLKHRRPALIAATAMCLCAGLASTTCSRIGVWRSKLALWSDCVAKSPRKARAHLGLGNAYRQAGKIASALEEYHTALGLAQTGPRWIRQGIREKLAAALLSLGRTEETVAELQSGLAEQPSNGELQGLLAMAHLQRHDLQAAAMAAEASVLGAWDLAASLRVLGMVRLAQGERDKAAAALEQAVHADPDEVQGKLLLARAYREVGRLREACDLLRGPVENLHQQVLEARATCPEL